MPTEVGGVEENRGAHAQGFGDSVDHAGILRNDHLKENKELIGVYGKYSVFSDGNRGFGSFGFIVKIKEEI